MMDADGVGHRLHGRLLLDEAAGIVVDGARRLPGGPLGSRESLVGAVRAAAERQLGSTVSVGRPLLVTLDETDGLVVVFGGARLGDGDGEQAPPGVRHVPSDDRPEAVEARRATASEHIHYRERLWWPAGPRVGHGNDPAPSLGELLREWADADIALWTLGVALGAFSPATTFGRVKGMFWSTGGPGAETAAALVRVMTALGDAGVVRDDGGGAEFRWAPGVRAADG